MAKLYGETIPEYVAKQIKVREEVLGRKNKRITTDLRILSQKSAWVRMISGVNLYDEQSYTPSFAKNFILAGGTMKWTGTEFEFRNEKPDFSSNSDARYRLTENLGVRPESGITGFDLKFKNRFGVIREANVNFVVWSREELNLAQDLFMRPGGQVIIEWGNSVYVDNEGNVKDSSFETSRIDKYFSQISIEAMYKFMDENKINTYGNIDGFLGLVTNFDWKFREDGGYDCSIKTVSTGALLESLTMIKPIDSRFITTTVLKDIENEIEKKTEEVSSSSISILHYFIYVVKKKSSNVYNPEVLFLDDLEEISLGFWSELFNGPQPTKIVELLKDLSDRELLNTSLPVISTKIKDSNDRFCNYVSLRTLLFLVNASISVSEFTDFSLPKFYIGNLDSDSKYTTPDKEKNFEPPVYRTFPLHISVNPLVAILPKSHPSRDTFKKLLDEKVGIESIFRGTLSENIKFPFDVISNLDNVSKKIRNLLATENNRNGNSTDILDIHVNLNLIEDILESNVTFEEESEIVKIKVFDFVKQILGRINGALGGINSLDIHFDEERQLYFIVDREVINEKIAIEGKQKVINLSESGLSNTVHKIEINSKISNQLSSMIAISAQADEMRDSQADPAFIDWTRGGKNRFYLPPSSNYNSNNENTNCEEKLRQKVIDRYIYRARDGSRIESSDYRKKLKECLKEKEGEDNPLTYFYIDLSQAYNMLSTKDYETLKKKFDKVRSRSTLTYKKLLFNDKFDTSENDMIGAQGIIPIELSMTVDGISGMKIGQIFRLGNFDNPSIFTPAKYDEYGFIIVGLDSKIGTDNKWITNIRAQTFKIGDLD